jgi:hypothetical protein
MGAREKAAAVVRWMMSEGRYITSILAQTDRRLDAKIDDLVH